MTCLNKFLIILPWILNLILNRYFYTKNKNFYNEHCMYLSIIVMSAYILSFIFSFFTNSIINDIFPLIVLIASGLYYVKLNYDFMEMKKTLEDLNKK